MWTWFLHCRLSHTCSAGACKEQALRTWSPNSAAAVSCLYLGVNGRPCRAGVVWTQVPPLLDLIWKRSWCRCFRLGGRRVFHRLPVADCRRTQLTQGHGIPVVSPRLPGLPVAQANSAPAPFHLVQKTCVSILEGLLRPRGACPEIPPKGWDQDQTRSCLRPHHCLAGWPWAGRLLAGPPL